MKVKKILAALVLTIGMVVGLAAETVIFEPGVTPVKGGEVVEVNGTKYFKIKCNGYNTTFKIPAVDCSAFTEFEATVMSDKEKAEWQGVVAIKDKGYGDISAPTAEGLTTEPKTVKAAPAKQESWNTLSKSKKAELIQPMIQDMKQFNPQNGYLLIGKVVAR